MSKIVAAVGTCGATLDPSRRALGALIEAAMSRAVLECCEEGLRVDADAEQIRDRMMAARAEVVAQYWAHVEQERADAEEKASANGDG